MKKTKLYLIRHAESIANEGKLISSKIPGKGLSKKGIQQAKRAGEKVKKLDGIKDIYCSPFKRALETLYWILEENPNFQNNISVDNRIKELDYGRYELIPTEVVSNNIQITLERALRGDNEIRFGLTGENEGEIIQRIYTFLIELINKGKPSLIVTHECVIHIISRLYQKIHGVSAPIKAAYAKLTPINFSTEDVEIIKRELEDFSLVSSPTYLHRIGEFYYTLRYKPSLELPSKDGYMSDYSIVVIKKTLYYIQMNKKLKSLLNQFPVDIGSIQDNFQIVGHITIKSVSESLQKKPEKLILPVITIPSKDVSRYCTKAFEIQSSTVIHEFPFAFSIILKLKISIIDYINKYVY